MKDVYRFVDRIATQPGCLIKKINSIFILRTYSSQKQKRETMISLQYHVVHGFTYGCPLQDFRFSCATSFLPCPRPSPQPSSFPSSLRKLSTRLIAQVLPTMYSKLTNYTRNIKKAEMENERERGRGGEQERKRERQQKESKKEKKKKNSLLLQSRNTLDVVLEHATYVSMLFCIYPARRRCVSRTTRIRHVCPACAGQAWVLQSRGITNE